VVGIDRFGESAPAAELYEFFGITAAAIAAAARRLLAPVRPVASQRAAGRAGSDAG